MQENVTLNEDTVDRENFAVNFAVGTNLTHE